MGSRIAMRSLTLLALSTSEVASAKLVETGAVLEIGRLIGIKIDDSQTNPTTARVAMMPRGEASFPSLDTREERLVILLGIRQRLSLPDTFPVRCLLPCASFPSL